MRRKSKYYLFECILVLNLFVVLLIFSIPRFLNAQNINLPKYFPDPFFRAEVEKYMGVEPGRPFSVPEAAQRKGVLLLKGNNSDLKGIEYLRSLEEVTHEGTLLKDVDLSKNTALKRISLEKSFFNRIILPKGGALRNLNLTGNRLTHLDASGAPHLERLGCSDNLLVSLNVSNNIELEWLNCACNQLRNVDVSMNIRLKSLYCFKNNIDELKSGVNSVLEIVDYSNNYIECVAPLLNTPSLIQADVRYNVLKEKSRTNIEIIQKRMDELAESKSLYVQFQYDPQRELDASY